MAVMFPNSRLLCGDAV